MADSNHDTTWVEIFASIIGIYLVCMCIGSVIRVERGCDRPKLNIEKLIYTRALCEAEVR